MSKTLIRDFTTGKITPQLLHFALPLFLSNLLQVVYNMVDMAVVGKVLGNPGLSAVSVGGDVTSLLTFVAMGFSAASQVIIARYIGSGQKEKISRFLGTMSGFLVICALFMSVLALIFQDFLLAMMNTPDQSYEGAKAYSTVCICGLVFTYGYNAISAVLRGMGDSKRPFLCIAIAAVMNLILDIVFVVFLHMGPGGAALATILSQAVSFLTCAAILYKKRAQFELTIRPHYFFRWDREMLADLLKLGAPMALKSASIHVSKIFVNAWINSYGVAVSAFAGIATKLSSISVLVSNAMNTAGSTMIGQNLAAGKLKRVKKIMGNMAVVTLTMAAVCSVLLCLFPEEIFSFFTKGAEDKAAVMAISPGYLPIAVLLFLASALRAVMNGLINGSGHHKINFVTAVLDGIVMRIGLSVLFGLVLDMQHYGFWLGDALAGFTPFFIGLVFFLSGKWKTQVVKKG